VIIEHSVLPLHSSAVTHRARGLHCFKLVAVVGVLVEKFEVGISVDMDDDGGVVSDVML
jgi:hypothetical protein